MNHLFIAMSLAFVASLVGTGLVRRYALARDLLDLPGDARRNHQVATPRGGGIAFAALLVATVAWLAWQVDMGWGWLMAGMLAVGVVGVWDDHRSLPALLRLAVHAIAAVCMALAAMAMGSPLWLAVLAALAALVLVNVWNFMDGIDGIAASQAMVVAAFAVQQGTGGVLAPITLAVVAGFLCWNFPRARIFMGDGGSGVLGYAMAALLFLAGQQSVTAGLAMLLPLSAFLLDAGLTLAGRIWRKERWWQAHSSHSYQLLARHVGRHVPVTMGYLAWTSAAAVLAVLLMAKPEWLPWGLLIWYFLGALAWRGMRAMARSATGVRCE